MISCNFPILAYYLAANLIILALLLITGQILTVVFLPGIAKDTSYKALFVKLFSATISVIFVYAQVKSGFSTIFLLVYPVLLFLFAYRFISGKIHFTRPDFDPRLMPIRNLGKSWILAFLISAMVMAVYAFVLLDPHSCNFKVPHSDFITYSNIANALNITGVESFFYQPNLCRGFPLSNANSLYHYPELWLNSLMIFLTGNASVLTLFFVTVPLLMTILVFGILAIFEKFSSIRLKTILIAVIIANLGGIYLPFYENFALTDHWVGILNPGYFSHPKYCFSAVIMIAFVLLIFEEMPVYAFIILLLLPVGNAGNFPSVTGGVIVFILILYFSKYRLLSNKELSFLLLCYLLFTAAFISYGAVFCKLFSNKGLTHSIFFDLLYSTERFQLITKYTANVAYMVARAGILYFPFGIFFLLLYFFERRVMRHYGRSHIILFGLPLLITGTGAFSAFIFDSLPDTNQLFYCNLPLLNIAIITAIAPLVLGFKEINNISRGALLSLLILMMGSLSFNIYGRFSDPLCKKFNYYGADYTSKVKATLKSDNLQLGGYWLSKNHYQTTVYSYILFDKPAQYLCLNSSFVDLIDMNNYYAQNNPDNSNWDLINLNNTTFQRFLNYRNAHPEPALTGDLQYDFLRRNKISFGFAYNLDDVPPAVKEKITYVTRDSLSGEYFLRF